MNADPANPRGSRVTRAAVGVLIAGLLVTGGLAVAARTIDNSTEARLLDLQVKETGAVLQAAIPTVQTPLTSLAAVAAAGHGDLDQFRTSAAPSTGDRPRPFTSVALWTTGPGGLQELATQGTSTPPTDPENLRSAVSRAASSTQLIVSGPFGTGPRRLIYAVSARSAGVTYVVSGEADLGSQPRVARQKGSPFSALHYALYLGAGTSPGALLQTDLSRLPVTGRRASITVPFGSNAVTLVATPAGHLSGGLSLRLWWIAALAGTALSVAAAGAAARLGLGREAAERLTQQVQGLLSEQRGIAEALQHALLPTALPEIDGVEFAGQYLPGVTGVEIGGDWYDAIRLDDHRFFFVVGDVSGRGLAAGAVMGSLRFAIRAFASEGHSPPEVLRRLRPLLDLNTDGHFATVLCGVADTASATLVVASAGHLPPLLLGPSGAALIDVPPGAPIGTTDAGDFETRTVTIPPGACLLAFTDGLVERRDEGIDEGLDRLIVAAQEPGLGLGDLLRHIVATMTDSSNEDDTAVLGIRWHNPL